VSLKKLATGDGQWSTTKTVLAWELDMQAMALSLPMHWALQLHDILTEVPWNKSHIPTQHWHQIYLANPRAW